MRTLFIRCCFLLAALTPLWLSSGAALAATGAPTILAPVAAPDQAPPTWGGGRLAVASWRSLHPQTGRATCNAASTPKDCADAIVEPGNRLLQISILIIIEVAAAVTVIGVSVSLLRGIVGISAGAPRAVADTVYKAGGIVLLMVVMLLTPKALQLLFSGTSMQFQLPNIQQLIPLPGN